MDSAAVLGRARGLSCFRLAGNGLRPLAGNPHAESLPSTWCTYGLPGLALPHILPSNCSKALDCGVASCCQDPVGHCESPLALSWTPASPSPFHPCRREAPQVPGVWQGIQPELQPHHPQPQAHRLQALWLRPVRKRLPEEGGPQAAPGDTAWAQVSTAPHRRVQLHNTTAGSLPTCHQPLPQISLGETFSLSWLELPEGISYLFKVQPGGGPE